MVHVENVVVAYNPVGSLLFGALGAVWSRFVASGDDLREDHQGFDGWYETRTL